MSEDAKMAMRKMKVYMCVEYKMTKDEMSEHTGLSLKNIQKVLDADLELSALHTFSLVERTAADDRRIEHLKRFL